MSLTHKERTEIDINRCVHIYKNRNKYGQSEKNYFNSRPRPVRQEAIRRVEFPDKI